MASVRPAGPIGLPSSILLDAFLARSTGGGRLQGLAFFPRASIYSSRGEVRKVYLFHWDAGRRRAIDSNHKGYRRPIYMPRYLALDSDRGIL